MTTERKAGWFWVRRDDIGWVVARHEPGRTRAADEMGDEPAPWVFAGLSFPDETWEEIGDRIPAPDEGWRCVPAEPTIEMLAALGWGGDVNLAIGHGAITEEFEEEYAAMLAAAPKPGGE